jgi:diketogulonate reductase-like aldo/keto reductase
MEELESTLPISQDITARVPSMGMAAFRNDIASVTQFEVTERINQGIRVFEIAEVFANGHEVIGAINDAKNLDRSEVFIILKLWPKKKSPDDIIKSTKSTLRFMGLSHVDLLMLDAKVEGNIPQFIEQWKAMEDLKDKVCCNDFILSIGLSHSHQIDLILILESFRVLRRT